jgi:hypothetical protein
MNSVYTKFRTPLFTFSRPRTTEVFYIGKGTGNRVFEHVACALTNAIESDKLNRIRAIEKSGNSVEHFVLRHGLTERDAFEVEAAVIDFIGMPSLSNLQSGHYSTDYGIKSTDEVIAMYSVPPFETSEPVLLININKLFDREMTAAEIYDATRKSWVVGHRKKQSEIRRRHLPWTNSRDIPNQRLVSGR